MNAAGKKIDTTYLSLDQAEERGFIHRDYIAHCLRWSHVVKRLYERHFYKRAIILDVGCGREIPLAKLLYSSRLSPLYYYGVDYGPIENESIAVLKSAFRGEFWDHEDFAAGKVEFQQLPNIVTCFEMLEHIEPEHVVRTLRQMLKVTSADCRFFISTPCWNRTDCAAHHVNEMTYEALAATFERLGFKIENVYGTFASIRDYQHLLGNATLLFNRLREYYDSNVLSCIFAPLFPAQSRNCLWELSKATTTCKRFEDIEVYQQPWTSSIYWKDLANG